jgi:bacteriochlorophyll 4-vinyl reductase
MNEAGVGRVLVASLHQGISDLIPTRLEFYENWLHPAGLRDGRIGLPPLNAVLSFLRQEGERYAPITARAGEYAAEWTVASLPSMARALVGILPLPLRVRAVLHIARRLVRRTYRGSRGFVRVRKGQGTLDLRRSIFCGVREPFPHPLCGYYAAAVTRLLALFDVDGEAQVTTCRGAGDPGCVLSVSVRGSLPGDSQAEVRQGPDA